MTQKAFITLVRLGIGHNAEPFPFGVDWSSIEDLAAQQGLSAIVLDGIERLPDKTRPPKELLLQWIGNTLQSYEYRYEMYRRTIGELAEWHNSNGFKMMVIKGYACSLNWPKHNHRPCGDIDIWQFGKQKEADNALAKEKGIKIDNSHQHHTVFYWRDFMVENHYDFINVFHHKSSAEIEKVFKQLGKDDSHFIEMRDTSTGLASKVYLPSPNLHALFLLRHAISEFASSSINLRQVLDWAFFVEKQGKDVDWEWLIIELDEYGMRDFFNCLNGICVEDLGFEAEFFPYVQYNPDMKERVRNEIITPEFQAVEPKSLLPRVVFKYKRWKANGWKHKLCYKESMWSAFWSGVWNHLLKPASI